MIKQDPAALLSIYSRQWAVQMAAYSAYAVFIIFID